MPPAIQSFAVGARIQLNVFVAKHSLHARGGLRAWFSRRAGSGRPPSPREFPQGVFHCRSAQRTASALTGGVSNLKADSAGCAFGCPSSSPPLHNGDLLLGQPRQLVHQRVDLLVGGLDLALAEIVTVRSRPRCFRGDPTSPERAPSRRPVAGLPTTGRFR